MSEKSVVILPVGERVKEDLNNCNSIEKQEKEGKMAKKRVRKKSNSPKKKKSTRKPRKKKPKKSIWGRW